MVSTSSEGGVRRRLCRSSSPAPRQVVVSNENACTNTLVYSSENVVKERDSTVAKSFPKIEEVSGSDITARVCSVGWVLLKVAFVAVMLFSAMFMGIAVGKLQSGFIRASDVNWSVALRSPLNLRGDIFDFCLLLRQVFSGNVHVREFVASTPNSILVVALPFPLCVVAASVVKVRSCVLRC